MRLLMKLTRVPPKFPPEMEAIVTRAIGCAMRVHRSLGPGFAEGIYHDAMQLELTAKGLFWQRQYPVSVIYRGQATRRQFLDLVVDRFIVVEVKAVDRLHPVHVAQILSYMKAGRFPIGLLMNFNAPYLKGQLRRFVL
jgi:GxxExxY protein